MALVWVGAECVLKPRWVTWWENKGAGFRLTPSSSPSSSPLRSVDSREFLGYKLHYPLPPQCARNYARPLQRRTAAYSQRWMLIREGVFCMCCQRPCCPCSCVLEQNVTTVFCFVLFCNQISSNQNCFKFHLNSFRFFPVTFLHVLTGTHFMWLFHIKCWGKATLCC